MISQCYWFDTASYIDQTTWVLEPFKPQEWLKSIFSWWYPYQVMRINKMIYSGKIFWSSNKFSQRILLGNVWRSVLSICKWVLRLIGEIEFNFADMAMSISCLKRKGRISALEGFPLNVNRKYLQKFSGWVCDYDFINRLINDSCGCIPKLDYINSLTWTRAYLLVSKVRSGCSFELDVLIGSFILWMCYLNVETFSFKRALPSKFLN